MPSLKQLLAFVLLLSIPVAAQSPAAPSEAAAAWNALLTPAMDAERSASVENLVIQRDRAKITLTSGTIQFTRPANGVVFGAVFRGQGRLEMDAPNGIEAGQLQLFTGKTALNTTFTEATFSASDGLFDEVAKRVQWSAASAAPDTLYADRQRQREDWGAAYLPRLFKGVMSPDRARTAYFLADFKTSDDWVELAYDAMEQEEVRVGQWKDTRGVQGLDVWMSFPAKGADPRLAYADPGARVDYTVPSYKIDGTVAENADLSATVQASVQSTHAGERVLLFDLDSNLRVDSVKDADGQALEFFQARETKDRAQSYGDYIAVALRKPTQAGAVDRLDFHFAGSRVVRKVGDGNYFCQSSGWYPAMMESPAGTGSFAFRSNFEINFRSPKKFTFVATGDKVSAKTDGDWQLTSWKSSIPLAVAGFAFGDYKVKTDKVDGIEVQVYANNKPDDRMKAIQDHFDNSSGELAAGGSASHTGGELAAIGNLSMGAMAQTISTETANTLRLFQDFYGPYPYKQLAVTNIPGGYGQGWPGLLYLSWVTFLDSTQRHGLGIDDQVQLTEFFRGHESSHQWWGHRVGWKSYHDQWLSEGFAEFSGNLYVEARRTVPEALLQWRKERENLLYSASRTNSRRVDSLGPIWLGQRVASSAADPGAFQDLIYSKGGYVLYMLRMMMYDFGNQDRDHFFKAMMQDFTKTYENKPASTEDFEAMVEKHMTVNMVMAKSPTMKWFFDEYVYGTGIPKYQFTYTTEPMPDGKTMKVSGKLIRSGVPDDWQDLVALYGHSAQGLGRLGFLHAAGPVTPFEAVLPIGLRSFSINDYEELLAEVAK